MGGVGLTGWFGETLRSGTWRASALVGALGFVAGALVAPAQGAPVVGGGIISGVAAAVVFWLLPTKTEGSE